MKRLIAATLCMAILTGCGQTETAQTVSEQPATTLAETSTAESAKTTAYTTTTMEETTTALAEPEYTDSDVSSAKNWLTGIWNNCVDIEAYVSRGTDCTGKEIDIEFYIDGAKRDYDKKDGYDKVIHSLDDSIPDQEMLIKAWDKCIEQTDMLLDKAFNETPKPNDKNYDFNIDLLKQYKDQFGDSYRTVKFGDPNVVGTDDGEPKFVFK